MTSFAWELMTGEDWGNGPVEESDGYDFPTWLGAFDAALDRLHAGEEDGRYNGDQSGIYVIEEPDEAHEGDPRMWTWNTHSHRVAYAMGSDYENVELP